MKIIGEQIEKKLLEVDIKNEEIFNALIRMCNLPTDAFIRNGEIVTAEDISYHGSPCYVYTKYKVEPQIFEFFKKVIELKEFSTNLGFIK